MPVSSTLSQYSTLVPVSRELRSRVSWVSLREADISSVAPRITSSKARVSSRSEMEA